MAAPSYPRPQRAPRLNNAGAQRAPRLADPQATRQPPLRLQAAPNLADPMRGRGSGGGGLGGGHGGGGHGGGHGGGGGAHKVDFNSPLYQPGQQLSGRSLYRAGQALAEAQYGPTIHTDRQTMRQNARQGAAAEKLTAGYFDQLGQFTQQSMRAERNIAGHLSGQLAGLGDQTAQQLGMIGQNATGELNRYAPGDQSLAAPGLEALTRQIAQQKGTGALNTEAFRASGVQQGANYSSLAASNLGTQSLGGQQELGNIAASTRLANEPLTNQISGLLAKRGALAAADVAKLRQEEITNQLTRQGLGLKSKALAVTAAYNKGRLALSALDARIRANEYAAANRLGWARLSESKRHDLASEANAKASINARLAASHGSGAVKPLATSLNDTQMTLMGSAYAALHSYIGKAIDSKHPGKGKWTASGVISALQGGNVPHIPRVNRAVAEAALELYQGGSITSKTLNDLHNLGMHNITWNGQPIKVRDGRLKGVTGGTGQQAKGFTG